MTAPMLNKRPAKQAQAEVITDIEHTYRAWRAFNAQQKDDIRRRKAEEAGVEDLLAPPGGQVAAVRAQLVPSVLQELTEIFERRRRDMQREEEAAARTEGREPLNVEQVAEQLVQRISDELEGRVHPEGKVVVWYDGGLRAYNRRLLLRSTTDDDYLATAGDTSTQSRRRIMIGALVGVIVLLVLVLLLFKPFAAASTAGTAAAPVALVGQQTAPLWDMRIVNVGGIAEPVPGVALGYPTFLCLSQAQQERLAPGATLVVTGTQSVRTYQLHATAPARPVDLRVADCTVKPPQALMSAQFVEVQTSHPRDPKLVRHVVVSGPDTDPATIPADRMLVQLVLTGHDGGPATLILADGTRWSQTVRSTDGDLQTLSYLVPLSTHPQPAGLEFGAGDGLPGVLALELPTPTNRAALLRRLLTVSGGDAKRTQQEGHAVIVVSLTVTLAKDTTPCALLATDMLVRTGDGSLVGTVEWSPPTLQPGQPVQITLGIPVENQSSPLEVSFATWRARIRW